MTICLEGLGLARLSPWRQHAAATGAAAGVAAAATGASSTTGAGHRRLLLAPTSTRFLRTSTWIVRALPLESAALISDVDLRVA